MALYRKYRPATFAEVVGQEHVTEPLSTALDTGRINHAYLFSGPRGCGKTSSARILARSLNCEQGPTSTPCGVCASCVALAPGGPGNLDVIELDAASHGGVDDTRELRDRAFYAPAESRYRVFIVDEAHMVTTAGFNALLKIVEEPPAHLIFIFATTEPDKVLPTIRSRTHHYPFRLLPPATMRGLLGRICEQEHVTVEEAVYPLVIRAGGGSPRDSLSVLDQLLAGAGPEGVTYHRAVALLGVTDVALIDDAVQALADDDGAALFGTVDRVMEAGHDPRRFAVDLLERFRDLILLRAVPDAVERGLVAGPEDVLDRMREQAERIGPATLTRYAELLHEGLGEMRGATAPRLLLEVVCARMLLPAVSDAESATLQRLERLERGMAGGVFTPPTAPDPSGEAGPAVPRPGNEPPRRRGAEALAALKQSKAKDDERRPGDAEPNPPASAGTGESGQPEAAVDGGGPGTTAGPADELRRAVDEPSPDITGDARAVRPEAARAPATADAPPANGPAADPPPDVTGPRATGDGDSRAAVPEAGRTTPAQPRGAADPAPEIREAQDVPPADRPSEPAATPRDDDLLRAVEGAWADIRAKVREYSATMQAMLSGASVARIEGSAIVFAHPSPVLAGRLSEPRNIDAVRAAVRAVLGHDHEIRWESGAAVKPAPAANRGKAGGAPANRGGQGRGQGAARFSRPSQAGSAAAAEAAGRAKRSAPSGDDDIPPPDYPDLPDDPGPGDYPPPDPVQTDGADGGYPPAAVPGPLTAEEEQEMLAEAARPVAPEDRRDPDEVALELLRAELGATRLDG
ncbi:DNA polymerase III subunit gamma and tau [Nocardia farcinica]|uniref:DNA polymerase III subunit gamma and tau n=1 Tax=Nocardia farcinica TaxID=37329 RepID=UPI001895E8A9|nr:DNA polymerase III subunit gamma and tau [Nocardia farcinica]MBF6294928.1 DNA polymerase III subunit gamma and tau [Nocardia farcinica]MBF6381414.1 DNA polymerase III subunit gamma and tau [Nocardia farcinica]MBF6572086.1 DNA polymerase III subunit gamma and tau [Nocardia farcinica]